MLLPHSLLVYDNNTEEDLNRKVFGTANVYPSLESVRLACDYVVNNHTPNAANGIGCPPVKLEQRTADPESKTVITITPRQRTDKEKDEAYLDWVNNYATTKRFAEAYDITQEEAHKLIEEGRELHEKASGITTKDGLLWLNGKVLSAPVADARARAEGFQYAEQLVRHLEEERRDKTPKKPNHAFTVDWEEDPFDIWDGDGPDPEESGYTAYNVTVTATAIHDGKLVTGKAYLGGCYSKDGGKDDPEVGGYLPQLKEEALAALIVAIDELKSNI